VSFESPNDRARLDEEISELEDADLVQTALDQYSETFERDERIDPRVRELMRCYLGEAERCVSSPDCATDGRRRLRSFLLNERLRVRYVA
jgi:hypothetical protein